MPLTNSLLFLIPKVSKMDSNKKETYFQTSPKLREPDIGKVTTKECVQVQPKRKHTNIEPTASLLGLIGLRRREQDVH
eukprot:1637709-Amphidinium_carterae.1